ncbi:MAG: hypothetical protein AB1679_12510 [Actinomycetota bacterium]|jgi:hypothetical protein
MRRLARKAMERHLRAYTDHMLSVGHAISQPIVPLAELDTGVLSGD